LKGKKARNIRPVEKSPIKKEKKLLGKKKKWVPAERLLLKKKN